MKFNMKLLLVFGLLGYVGSDASVVSSPNIVPIQGGLGGDGITTRYWDCCAPSCAYAPFDAININPDQTCEIDGVTNSTRINNGNSSCDAGVAYTCDNHQPWAVNSTLAYGYIGVSFTQETDKSPCCHCLLLTFRDQLDGKKMLVQIVNDTGIHYTKNQFHILIPGGGVGDFNTGCMTQWDTGEDGWGQRYGGVASIEECSTLPEGLQPGCRFRFEFMEGVDNPKVIFSEVRCPVELVTTSGCGDL